MIYNYYKPSLQLEDLISCYWLIENEDASIVQTKIIPDGYPEIIFHYHDPFKINLHGQWETQSKALFAGQITNHFFLENTGKTGMWGIKFNPEALSILFDISMDSYTNKVTPLIDALNTSLSSLSSLLVNSQKPELKVNAINQWFENYRNASNTQSQMLKPIISHIIETKGTASIRSIASQFQIGERHLERIFKKRIGLSPKFFSRIIRFSSIFQLMQEKDYSWTELAFYSGHFDQSHFIKNFKAFTGEDPSKYEFDEENMANFFLKIKPN